MNKIYIFVVLLFLPLLSSAQYFRSFAEVQGNDIVFFVQVNPGGGNITTNWSDVEFFLRYPTGSPAFSYGAITVNSVDFPGVSIPYNGNDAQGSEAGYVNSWFGTFFLPGANTTYTDGQSYEVFRVTLNVDPSTIAFEQVHNTGFFPTYLALTNGSGGDLSAPSGNKFIGGSIVGSNHILLVSSALPVSLSGFSAKSMNNKDAMLEWQTESEINSSHFEVQRSWDADSWTSVGQENAVGESFRLQSYRFIDKNVNFNASSSSQAYYRLKMVDQDGSYEYSEIRPVGFTGNRELKIYPNPTASYFKVEVASDEFTIEVFDLSGKRMLQLQNQYEIDISSLAAGAYQVKVTDPRNTWSESLRLIVIE